MKDFNRSLCLLMILALLLGSILLGGCGKTPEPPADPVEPELTAADPEASLAEPEPVEAEPEPENIYLEDYREFWEILENDYPYLPYLETRYPNLNETRESFEAVAAQTDNVDDFIKLLHTVCRRLGNFAHLNVIEPGFYQYCYAACVNDQEQSENAGLIPYREALTDPTISSVYQPAPADYAQEKSVQLPEVEVRYYEDCDALLLVINTFDYAVVERDRTVLTDALTQYPNTKHIIFDIRQNGGGDTTYWWQNLVEPLGGNRSNYFERMYYRDTPRITPFFSYFDSVPVSELEDVPDWVEELKLDRCILTEHDTESVPSTNVDPLPGSDAKRWVIVGQTVYSSAEAFTIFCKCTGWATVVGSTTGGDGIGVSPVFVKLDNTGVLIRFTAHVGENPSTGLPSAYGGTVPDHSGGLETCLKLIRGE